MLGDVVQALNSMRGGAQDAQVNRIYAGRRKRNSAVWRQARRPVGPQNAGRRK